MICAELNVYTQNIITTGWLQVCGGQQIRNNSVKGKRVCWFDWSRPTEGELTDWGNRMVNWSGKSDVELTGELAGLAGKCRPADWGIRMANWLDGELVGVVGWWTDWIVNLSG